MRTRRRRRVAAWLLAIALVLCLVPVTGNSESYAQESETQIVLSDTQTTVDGQAISKSPDAAVYAGADIVYYEDGHDSSYGEGSDSEAHTASEAAEHTVITITQPGTYRVSGTLSKGQLAVDLGEDASDNPDAVVTLILDGVDITCTVAPAVIFYNVWESESATQAGAVVTLADDSVNTINGSHVAKIYKEGTTKKLHKYDGAFYSKMTMNIRGESKNNGELHITADNEGLDAELHMTVDGGKIWIQSQDDGINTNEDDVSIFTMNDGYLYVNAGNGSEGDGIDSNGYITINGGTVIAIANATTADGGLDADHDILINGGTVVALGMNNEEISSSSTAPFLQLSYAAVQPSGQITYLTDADGKEILAYESEKTYQSVVLASPDLAFDTTYYLYNGGTLTGAKVQDGLYAAGGTYSGGTQQQYNSNAADGIGMPGGEMTPPNGNGTAPADGSAPEAPDGNGTAPADGTMPTPPEGNAPADGTIPEAPDGNIPADGTIPTLPDGTAPSDGNAPEMPDGSTPGAGMGGFAEAEASYSTEFTITQENRNFRQITAVQEASDTPTVGDDNTIGGDDAAGGNIGGETGSTSQTVTVKKTAVSKVIRSKNGKKMTVTVKKSANADGYQIRYSTSKKFTKATTKTVTVSKKTLKKTISSLKAKKAYYVSARAYQSVDGMKYYSAWSAAKSVKAK